MVQKAQSKVLLALEKGVIVAKRYNWVSGGIVGIAALCDDGTSKLYAVDECPTYQQYYRIEIAPGATYAQTRQAVLDATGWSEDEFPWAETDDNGDLVPGTDTEERLLRWLNSSMDPDEDFELLCAWGDRESTQYAPGFELMQGLPAEDVERLGLFEGDLGGPASFVPCVATRTSIAELNAAIAAHGLPFVVVDDEGSEEGFPIAE